MSFHTIFPQGHIHFKLSGGQRHWVHIKPCKDMVHSIPSGCLPGTHIQTQASFLETIFSFHTAFPLQYHNHSPKRLIIYYSKALQQIHWCKVCRFCCLLNGLEIEFLLLAPPAVTIVKPKITASQTLSLCQISYPMHYLYTHLGAKECVLENSKFKPTVELSVYITPLKQLPTYTPLPQHKWHHQLQSLDV